MEKRNKNNKQKKVNKKKPSKKIVNPYNFANQALNKKKTLEMLPETLDFARVYSDPWSNDSVRLPVLPINLTQTHRVVFNGNGQCNSSGIGFVGVQPIRALVNNSAFVSFSNGPTAPATIANPPTADVGGGYSNSPFDQNRFTGGDALIGRVVAAGLRIRYSGTNLNQAGHVYSAEFGGSDTAEGNSVADFKIMPGYKTKPFTKSFHTTTRMIETTNDFMYNYYDLNSNTWAYTIFKNMVNPPKSDDQWLRLAMMIQSEPAAPFEIQVVVHFEVFGQNLTARDAVPSDLPGVEKVTNAFRSLRKAGPTVQDHNVGGSKQSFLSKILKYVPTVIEVGSALLSAL